MKEPKLMEPIQPEALTKRQAATYLNITMSGLERYVREKQLTPFRWKGSRRYLFDRQELRTLLDKAAAANCAHFVPKQTSKWGFSAIAGRKKGKVTC